MYMSRIYEKNSGYFLKVSLLPKGKNTLLQMFPFIDLDKKNPLSIFKGL